MVRGTTAQVVAFPADTPLGSIQPLRRLTRTDDRGAYRIFGLAPGRYTIAVVPGPENTTTPLFATGFLGGNGYSEARFLDLKPGDTADESNVSVDVTRSVTTIEGSVANGCLPESGCHSAVFLFPRDGIGEPIDQRFTDDSGRFTFDGVPEGEYFLAAWAPGMDWPLTDAFPGTTRLAAIKQVVTREIQQEVDLTLTPTIRITAKLTVSGTNDMSSVCPDIDRLGLQSEDGWPFTVWSAISSAGRAQWGPLPAGTYRVLLPSHSQSCALLSIEDGPYRVAPNLVHLTESSSFTLSLTSVPGEISGTVSHSGTLSSGYVVLLDSQNQLRQLVWTDTGHFTLSYVPLGSFRVAAFGEIYSAVHSASSTLPQSAAVSLSPIREQVNDVALMLQ